MTQPNQPQPAQRPGAGAQPPRRGEIVDHPALETRVAHMAKPRRRHRLVAASFLLAVAAPAVAAVAYLYVFAADQYASRVAFSIRDSQSPIMPMELLGALTQSVSAAGADAEILYEFMRSQQIVEAAEATLPLRAIWNAPEDDVVFRLGADRSIEDVTDYWRWMTDISFDSGAGIVNFEVRAFDPESARQIARFVLDESTRLVNDLSRQAREDAVGIAGEVLAEAEERLREVRREIRSFRDLEQELDPSQNARAALELVANLEGMLAETRIELDSTLELVGERNPRVQVLRQKIASLEKQIADERLRLGAGFAGATTDADGNGTLPRLLAQYEELAVDREFAEKAYVSALAAYEQAQVEARRQMRYLAPYIEPTLSAEPQYPERALLSFAVFGALLVSWAVSVLIVYNVRDRR